MEFLVNEEERYLFDLQGFIIKENVLSIEEADEYALEIDRLANTEYDDSWMIKDSQPTVMNNVGHVRINGLVNLTNSFDGLINHPRILPYLNEFIDGAPQLVNTWSIKKTGNLNHGGWHRGIQPTQYTFRNGKIRSEMINVIFFLTDNHHDDGCVWLVPASHKDNIDLKISKNPPPYFIKVTGKKGSAIIFSEAIIHCGGAKTSDRTRTNLYFNFIHRSFQPMSVENLHHYVCPPSVRDRFNEEQKKLTEWMKYFKTEEPMMV